MQLLHEKYGPFIHFSRVSLAFRSIQEYLGYSPVRHSLRHAIRSGLLLLLRYLFMAIGLLSHSLLLY